MAKRFIDTEFFKSPFVRGLKGAMKGLYSFIICDSNGAGIWSADFEIASLYVGFKIESKEFIEAFVKTGKTIDLNNGKYFFPDFIEHQYPKGLQALNPAHSNIIVELQKYDLIDEHLRIIRKPLISPFEGSKVMVKVKDKEMDKVKEKRTELIFTFSSDKFLSVWNTLIKQPKWKRKTLDALQACLDKISKLTEQQAIECMNDALAGGWQGLFHPKNQQSNGTRKPTRLETFLNRPLTDEEYAQQYPSGAH